MKQYTSEDQRILDAIIAKMKGLKGEGKDLISGYFGSEDGSTILSIKNCSQEEYSVYYKFSDRSWNFVVPKTAI